MQYSLIVFVSAIKKMAWMSTCPLIKGIKNKPTIDTVHTQYRHVQARTCTDTVQYFTFAVNCLTGTFFDSLKCLTAQCRLRPLQASNHNSANQCAPEYSTKMTASRLHHPNPIGIIPLKENIFISGISQWCPVIEHCQ